jgi:hypothetical protein
MMNKKVVQRLRILQPAARAATDFAEVSEVISNLMDIVPAQTGLPNLGSAPLSLLAALPLLQGLLPEVRGFRVQRGDESVDLEWEAEIELEDGIRFGEGNCAAGAILCATIEILSAMESN